MPVNQKTVQKNRKRCSGLCQRVLPRTEQFWRPRSDSMDGFRNLCRACESKLRGYRRVGVKADALKQDPGKQPLRKTLAKSKIYVITYAQNATGAYLPFLESLIVYCKARGAELVVLPGRYRNPTSIWNDNNMTDEWWAKELHPYLFNGRKKLGENLTIYGDISIQPTAARPLTSFEVFSGATSGIFGHPKLALETIATAERYYPRILSTTGAVTKPNYTKSKAGKKSEAHHIYGAIVVEQGEKLFHMRQINATKDGAFIDLDKKYSATGVESAGRALALVCGDIHVERSDEAVLAATFDRPDSIVNVLKPKQIVMHDVLDFERRNHHTIGNFHSRYARVNGSRWKDNVEEEVRDAIAFVDKRTPPDTDVFVVPSNHDEAFDRWLETADFRKDPTNARFFVDVWSKKLAAFDRKKEWTGAFELLYQEYGAGTAIFLSREDPLKIADIYVNFHGDKGINGAKGATRSYAHLGVKTIIGHHHSPAIMDGCYQVGVTGRLDQDYNDLPSSWLNTHVLVYSNGKRAMVHVIDGAWRG